MGKISKIKSFGYIGAVLALAVATTVLPSVPAAKAAPCDGPQSASQLESILNSTWYWPSKITLCGDINGEVYVWSLTSYNLTIDLNGHSILNSGGDAIRVRGNAHLTIIDSIGGGEVKGAIEVIDDGYYTNPELIIAGGSFSRDPNNYIKDPNLKAYKSGLMWVVEPRVTSVVVDPSVITIRVGDAEPVSESVSVQPDSSTSKIEFESEDTAIATVDKNSGQVTGIAKGKTKIKAISTYEPNIFGEIEIEVLPKLTSVSASDVTVRVGESAIVDNVAVEDADITDATFTYVSADESVATVDVNTGEVTGVSAGTVKITVTATYVDKIGEMSVSDDIVVAVYDVVADETDTDGVAANTVTDVIDGGFVDDETKEAFGADYETTSESLKDAMNSGSVITTRLNIEESTDSVAMTKIDEALADINVTSIKYYDVTVVMEQNGDPFGLLRKLNDGLTFMIAEVEYPADGYARQYYLVAYHEGDDSAEILTEGVDFEIVDGKIYVTSDRFSTFAVAYNDTLLPVQKSITSPVTGENTNVNKSSIKQSLVSDLAIAITFASLFGAIGLVGMIKEYRSRK